MDSNNILLSIESRLPEFSKGKQQIALYILSNPNEAAFQTASQIGKAVNISESTVVRFAGDLGYKGFPPFQKALQQVVKSLLQKKEPLLPERSESKFTDPCVQEMEFIGEQLQQLWQKEAVRALETFSQALSRCNTLYLTATALGSLFLPYCKFAAQWAMDSVFTLCSSPKEALLPVLRNVSPGDMVLALGMGEWEPSFSSVLEEAKKQGAEILLLTDGSSQRLSFRGDLVLEFTPRGQEMYLPTVQVLPFLQGIFSLAGKSRASFPYISEDPYGGLK